jgi:hypothetical protein
MRAGALAIPVTDEVEGMVTTLWAPYERNLARFCETSENPGRKIQSSEWIGSDISVP